MKISFHPARPAAALFSAFSVAILSGSDVRASINFHEQHIITHRTAFSSATAFVPAWRDIENAVLPEEPSSQQRQEAVIDSALNPSAPEYSSVRPTLFRERHGWCPYSQRAWLALEHCNADYDTILIDNTGPGRKPSYFAGQTPQMRWPEGSTQGESMDLVREVGARFSSVDGKGSSLYPASMKDRTSDTADMFRKIFPSQSRPSSRAAFLFGWDGEPLWKSEFERVLSETNDLLGSQSSGGPFFCGSSLTAADIAWAPFLERYAAQLPCLHDGLNPRDSTAYPHLHRWFEAMETTVPAYACRVRGHPSSWRKVLTMAGFGNGGLPPTVGERMEDLAVEERRAQSDDERDCDQRLWDEYRSSRQHLALTPSAEAGRVLVTNRKAIVVDLMKRADQLQGSGIPMTEEGLDGAMRALATTLIGGGAETDYYSELHSISQEAKAVEGVGALATFLDDRMCVPRDMGAMSAAAIKRIASEVSSQLN